MGWYVWAAARVGNNTDKIFAVEVTFQVVDAQGAPLDEAERNGNLVLRAHEHNAVGARLIVSFGSKPVDVVVRASREELNPSVDDSPGSTLTVRSPVYVPPPPGPLQPTGSVKGLLVSNYTKSTVDRAIVAAICFGPGNKIIGGGEAEVTSIAAGSHRAVEVHPIWASARPRRCQMYAAQARRIIQASDQR